jgi:tetratricopeptide (TPR) repeat protein
MDYKKIFERFEDQNAFIKITKKPVIDGAQKSALNRKGNVLYNSGDIEGAKRIFLTTGYSDGLSRIGDAYKAQNRYLDALNMYRIAPNQKKFESLIMNLSVIIKNLIHEEGESPK